MSPVKNRENTGGNAGTLAVAQIHRDTLTVGRNRLGLVDFTFADYQSELISGIEGAFRCCCATDLGLDRRWKRPFPRFAGTTHRRRGGPGEEVVQSFSDQAAPRKRWTWLDMMQAVTPRTPENRE